MNVGARVKMLFPARISVALVLLFSCFSVSFGESVDLGPTGYSSRSYYAVKERHHAPRSWVPVGRALATHEVELRIGLRQAHFPDLEKRLIEGWSFNFLHSSH